MASETAAQSLPDPAEVAASRGLRLVPASHFTVAELTHIYNQTRADYLVPMPMDAARLEEYIHTYDINLDQSVVALSGAQAVGLGMLGVRPACTWVTRLGVLPDHRRSGAGEAILLALMTASQGMGIDRITLEVIKDNEPARRLFRKWGFRETRELIVLRRPAGPSSSPAAGAFRWLGREETIALVSARPQPLSWVNDLPSLVKMACLAGLAVTLADGSSGWLAFQERAHSRMTMATLCGDPLAVAEALMSRLYERFPAMGSVIENVAVSSPHLPALYRAGFVEAFRRWEMYGQVNRRGVGV